MITVKTLTLIEHVVTSHYSSKGGCPPLAYNYLIYMLNEKQPTWITTHREQSILESFQYTLGFWYRDISGLLDIIVFGQL